MDLFKNILFVFVFFEELGPALVKNIRDLWVEVSWWRVRPRSRAPPYDRFRV